MLNLFGWSPEVTAEYLRHLKRLGCSPGKAQERFTEQFEQTGIMPTFKEVAEKSLDANTENAWVYGQNGGHLDNAPFKVRLVKLNPNDPNETARYALCHCGCAECRPGEPPTLRSKPLNREKGHWVKRAEELAPLGREGFQILLGELSQSGNQLAINVRKGVGQ